MSATRLPPLTALRTFEAVARLKSFTKAAEELYVTRAAVSHQIKKLETYLGFQLIKRETRSIALTPAAEAALPKLREGFNKLSEAVHLMESHQSNENITVWVAPSFASKWLVPRLHSFSLKYPEIDMQISGNISLVDTVENDNVSMEEIFRTNHVDVAIRFGAGNYPDCIVDKLFSVKAIPLCSPDLLNNAERPLKTPEDLQYHTLLHDNTDYKGRPEWKDWLKNAGVSGVNVDRGIRFNHTSLAMDAAIDGQGVLMGIETLAKNDIEAGRLCQPFDLSLPLKPSYYVIYPEAMDFNRHAVDVFIEWILEESKRH